MLIVISPSKSVMKQAQPANLCMTQPIFIHKTAELVKSLRELSQKQLTKRLEVSDTLGKLNYDRYQSWDDTPARAALWLYSGDVYNGISAYSMNKEEIEIAQERLRIVSGLYGLLRPLDAIQPYRLEMKLPISVGEAKDLYEYWRSAITKDLKNNKSNIVLLCASNEYASLITQALPTHMTFIKPRFMQETDSGLKEKGLFAKYARGKLARWVIDNDVKEPASLKDFNEDGFIYASDLSSDTEIVYLIPKDFSLKGRFVKK